PVMAGSCAELLGHLPCVSPFYITCCVLRVTAHATRNTLSHLRVHKRITAPLEEWAEWFGGGCAPSKPPPCPTSPLEEWAGWFGGGGAPSKPPPCPTGPLEGWAGWFGGGAAPSKPPPCPTAPLEEWAGWFGGGAAPSKPPPAQLILL